MKITTDVIRDGQSQGIVTSPLVRGRCYFRRADINYNSNVLITPSQTLNSILQCCLPSTHTLTASHGHNYLPIRHMPRRLNRQDYPTPAHSSEHQTPAHLHNPAGSPGFPCSSPRPPHPAVSAPPPGRPRGTPSLYGGTPPWVIRAVLLQRAVPPGPPPPPPLPDDVRRGDAPDEEDTHPSPHAHAHAETTAARVPICAESPPPPGVITVNQVNQIVKGMVSWFIACWYMTWFCRRPDYNVAWA